MKLKLPRRQRVLRWIVFLVPILIFGLYIVLPVAFGVIAVFPYKESVGAPFKIGCGRKGSSGSR